MFRKHLTLIALFTALVGCQPAQSPAPDTAVDTAAQATPEIKTYSAETFFDTTTMWGSSISHDGNAVLVTSDDSGVFNSYRYPLDGSTPTQLTFSETDPNYAISWFPNDARFLYTADQGGNELNHVFVMTQDGNSIDLTPGENLKASFFAWHDNDEYFYLTSNERDAKAFDLYRYAASDYARELVYTNTDAWALNAISGDGRYLAITRTNSNTDSDVFIVDLSKPDSEPVHVTPHEGNVNYSVYTFTKDSTQLIYGSNEGRDFVAAYAFDIESGNHSDVYADDWDVSFLYFSENGRYRVVGINADSQTELVITDTRDGSNVTLPTLPAGDMRGVNFNDAETRMVFYINSDVAPSNLFTWEMGAAEASQLSNTLNPTINQSDLVASEVVRFNSFDELEVPGLLYKPHQASASNKVPAVIFIHGGPGGQTRKGYSPMMQHLVNHGYAMFGVNNRGSSGYGTTFYHLDDKKHGEDDLQDIVYSKYYLQSLDWVDPNRIAVMGGSYGGYLTMAAMTFTDEFEAGINIFGVTNWVRTLESIPPWWESFKQYLYDEMGDPATDKERLYRISPLFHADQIDKPVLVVQGANDPRVLQVESDEMVEAIRANNVPVEYVLFDDEGHGFRKKENRITAQNAYLNFLQTHL